MSLKSEYYKWLVSMVGNPRGYSKLLHTLYDTEFTYTIKRDSYRASAGVELRYNFALDNEYSIDYVRDYIYGPCNMLELMVSLACVVDDFLAAPDIDNQVDKCFMDMIDNLGLSDQKNSTFNIEETNYILDRFLNREYGHDGEGGLFYVQDAAFDFTQEELWHQACTYINSIVWDDDEEGD